MLFQSLLLLLSFLYTSCGLNQISFSGGGAFGAVEIGIIKRVVELNGDGYGND